MEPERLFVYGSLRPGRSNHGRLAALGGTWEPAVVRGRLEPLGWGAGQGYPGLRLDPEGDEVPGDLLTSADLAARWEELDAFEGEDYRRVETTVGTAGGERRAWVYTVGG